MDFLIQNSTISINLYFNVLLVNNTSTKRITKINDSRTFKAMTYILSIRLFKPVDIKKDDTDKKSLKNPYMEEEQTTQWHNGKVQKDQQRSTKHT